MKVREATKHINQWQQANSSSFEDFSRKVATLLLLCNTNSKHSTSAKHKKMWKTFSKIRISHEMKHTWEALISTCNIGTLDPLLAQYVQEHIIKEFIKVAFPTSEQESTSQPSHTMLVEEENAFRYVAGYIPYIRHKLERSSHPFKE